LFVVEAGSRNAWTTLAIIAKYVSDSTWDYIKRGSTSVSPSGGPDCPRFGGASFLGETYRHRGLAFFNGKFLFMKYRYKEKFEANGGFRFFRDKRTVLLQATSYGRRFTEQQLGSYVRSINGLLDSISGRPSTSTDSVGSALTKADFPVVNSGPLYKYVSDSTWDYIKRGSIQLGTATYYRTTENGNIKDEREGVSTFHLGDGNDQLHVSIISGFNCAIFCGTSYFEGEDDELMRSRFGEKRLRIDRVDEFVSRTCKLIGAYRARIYDVVYTDIKHFSAEVKGISRFIDITGKGDLTEQSLHKLNSRFFETFYDFAFAPSLFSKPTGYSVEHERRVVFELRDDLRKPTLIFDGSSLLDLIHLS
jgi:hypothetical protein